MCLSKLILHLRCTIIITGHGFQETENKDAQDELEKIYEWSMNTQAGTKIKVTGIVFLLHDTFYF